MNFDLEDLNYLENDLSIQEKVSLVFLIYGDSTKLTIESVIKKLYGFLQNPQTSSSFLREFASGLDDWREYIIDGLKTIGAFEVLEKLGLNKDQVHLMSSPIDLTLKRLYQACEECTTKTTEQFQKYIQEKLPQVIAFEVSKTRYMEFQLFLCISNNLVRLEQNEHTFLLDFFRNNQKDDVVGVLTGDIALFKLDSEPIETFPTQAGADSGFYVIKSGKILIINQQTFYREKHPKFNSLLPPSSLKDRQGTNADKKALSNQFEAFGYKVQVKENLTHLEIIEAVKQLVKESSEDGTDSILVCILSHGSEGNVYGSNSIPVKVKEIKSILSTELLANKPKILLIQACQGMDFLTKTQKPQPKIEHDGPTSSSTASMFGDFLIFWSSIEGFASFRHTTDGSWFIQIICKMIKEKYESLHLLDLCTEVIRMVSQEKALRNETMLPKFESTFMKKYVFPGYRYNQEHST